MQEGEDSSLTDLGSSYSPGASSDLPTILHALANKLLPIIAFSDLGVRNAQDALLLSYFEKIRNAAGDARDLLVSLRRDYQEKERRLNLESQKTTAGAVRMTTPDPHATRELGNENLKNP